jgi:hypothetical protein
MMMYRKSQICLALSVAIIAVFGLLSSTCTHVKALSISSPTNDAATLARPYPHVVVLPKNLALGGDAAEWAKQAAQHLAIDGAVALVQNGPSSGLISHSKFLLHTAICRLFIFSNAIKLSGRPTKDTIPIFLRMVL